MTHLKLVAAACLATACGTALAGKSNDTLVWATSSEVDTPDIYYQNLREVVIATQSLCDTLMYRNPTTGKQVPLLATSYKWIDDKTLQFKLRQGLKFSNGDTLDAQDVAYTFNFLSKPDSGMVTRFLVDWIDNVEVVDPQTVVFHAKKPTPMALSYLSGVTPIHPDGHYDNAPKVQRGGKTVVDYGAVMPVCVGPYNLKDFKSGKAFTLERNDAYFDGSPKGKPTIKYLKFESVYDTQAQLAGLLTGKIDWIWDVPSENAKQLKNMGKVTVEAAPTMRMSFLALDAAGKSGKSPLQNKLVRQAMNHAVDREAISKQLVGEGSTVLKSICHPTQAACTEDVPQYAYDPEKAKALLKEAGYADGFAFKIYAYRDRPYTEAVMNYLRAVGLKPSLEFLQWKALAPLIADGKTPVAHLTWGSQAITDASASTSHYYTFSPDDYAHDEKVRDLLEKADSLTDEAERDKLYKEALTLIAENAYAIPLFSYGRTYAFNKNLDFQVTPDEMAHFYLAKWK